VRPKHFRPAAKPFDLTAGPIGLTAGPLGVAASSSGLKAQSLYLAVEPYGREEKSSGLAAFPPKTAKTAKNRRFLTQTPTFTLKLNPLISILFANSWFPTAKSKAKPAGVQGAEIWAYIGPTPPTGPGAAP